MEPDEIGVVLSRASELHGRLNEAIERASQAESEFQGSTGSGNASPSNEQNGDAGDKPSSSNADGNKDKEQKASSSGESSEEARSLGVIRDALEVLEEQLESMQTVQQQQRTQREAALTQLEESRRSLLTKLKEHNGKEWQVVQQALAFAGEPVENRDYLRLPPYHMPLSEHSSPGDRPSPRHGRSSPKYNGSLRDMSLDHEEPPEDEDEENRYMYDDNDDNVVTHYHEAHHHRRQGGGLFGIPWGISRAFLAHAYTVAAKVAIVAACVAAALAIGEFGQTLDENISSPFGSRKRNSSSPSPPNTECPPGQKLVFENGQTKCIVRERVEVPFATELNDPDALHGRG